MLYHEEVAALHAEADRLSLSEDARNRLIVWALTARMTSSAVELIAAGEFQIGSEIDGGNFTIRPVKSNEPRQSDPTREGTSEAVSARQGD